MRCLIFFTTEIMTGLIFFWRYNEALCFSEDIMIPRLLRKHASLFLQKIWSASLFLHKQIKGLIISSEKKSSTKLFLQKKWSASLFLQNKMKRLQISWEKKLHYFFRTKSSASLFLQKKRFIFFEEIMRHFIFFEEIMRHLGLLPQ